MDFLIPQILRCEDLQFSEWDRIASATEKSDSNTEGTVFTEDLGFNVCLDTPEIMNYAPELGNDSEVPYIIEKQENVLNFEEYSKLVQTLNAEQKDIFNIILNWCRNLRKSQKTKDIPKPFHLFVTGGGGTGKSHLINAIVNMAKRELQVLCDDNPEGTVINGSNRLCRKY